MCDITIFGTVLAVAWHREVSLIEYQVETGYSKVINLLLKRACPK